MARVKVAAVSMVTELTGGDRVEGVIENADEHRLHLDQAIHLARETCQGLEFAYTRGIVHQDLKPGNVWLTGDGIAKIGDMVRTPILNLPPTGFAVFPGFRPNCRSSYFR